MNQFAAQAAQPAQPFRDMRTLYTSAAEKIAESSSGNLYLPTKFLSASWSDSTQDNYGNERNDGRQLMTGTHQVLTVGAKNEYSGYGPFQCCGSQVIHGLSQSFSNIRDMQDALALWLRTKGSHLTYYMLASTPQVNNQQTNEMSVLRWLIRLGAKEIDKRPNLFHSPNLMHLFVINLGQCDLSEFVVDRGRIASGQPGYRSFGFEHHAHNWVPVWWTKLSEGEQRIWLKQQEDKWQKGEAERKAREEGKLRARMEERLWNLAYDTVADSQKLDVQALHALLRRYGEARLIGQVCDEFQKFIDLAKGGLK